MQWGARTVDKTMQQNRLLARAGNHSAETMVRSTHRVQKSGAPKPTPSTVNDAARKPQSGRPVVFDFIYRSHLQRVYALCLRMVKDPARAEDLTQETFIQVYRKIDTFRGESAFTSWLYRVTTNLVLMSFRRENPVSVSLEQITSDPDGPVLPELARPDADLCGLFDRLDLQAVVPQLPRHCKTVFMLHDVQGYTHKEVATILGCSVGTSKSYLFRAHKRLRELLRDMSPEHSAARQEARE